MKPTRVHSLHHGASSWSCIVLALSKAPSYLSSEQSASRFGQFHRRCLNLDWVCTSSKKLWYGTWVFGQQSILPLNKGMQQQMTSKVLDLTFHWAARRAWTPLQIFFSLTHQIDQHQQTELVQVLHSRQPEEEIRRGRQVKEAAIEDFHFSRHGEKKLLTDLLGPQNSS